MTRTIILLANGTEIEPPGTVTYHQGTLHFYTEKKNKRVIEPTLAHMTLSPSAWLAIRYETDADA